MRVVLILLAVALAAVAALPTSERIVGGSVVGIDRYPMGVALLFSSTGFGTFRQACGGSILNTRAVLTAAHCPANNPVNRWRVRAGSSRASSGGVVHNTARVINHPQYNARTGDNDISLMHVTSAFSWTNNVRPGNIVGANYNLPDNSVLWAIGWGRTSFGGPASEDLRHVQIWTINQAVCRQNYATIGRTITDNMLCSGWLHVGGRDQCHGDSGGPLLHNNNIVGVCSWGHECARSTFPGVNARVSRYTSWIQNNA